MDRYCCGKGSGGTWSDVRCKNKPKFEHEGKSYCSLHYPPNKAERKRKLHEKWDADAKYIRDRNAAIEARRTEERAKLADYERLVKENEDLRAELERWKEVSRDEH
jgi:uncharacterized Zn finger protein (UPF0148 family)